MIRKFIQKNVFGIDENSTLEDRWKYMPTRDMFHPVLLSSLDDDLNIRNDSEFIKHVDELVNGCFVFPLFSERYCKFLIAEGDTKGTWKKSKHDPYAAFEINLFQLSYMIKGYHENVICMKVLNNVLSGLLNGYRAEKVENSFLIKYTLDTCTDMKMHHDEKSLVSVSINLNNDFGEGGLSFVREPENIVCPKAGYATMFAGNPFASHRAVPITSGERYVLVYWLR